MTLIFPWHGRGGGNQAQDKVTQQSQVSKVTRAWTNVVSLVHAGGDCPPSSETLQRTRDRALQGGLLESRCKAPLTIGCEYEKCYQTVGIQEGCSSSVRSPCTSTELGGCCAIVFFQSSDYHKQPSPSGRACLAVVIKTRKPHAASTSFCRSLMRHK